MTKASKTLVADLLESYYDEADDGSEDNAHTLILQRLTTSDDVRLSVNQIDEECLEKDVSLLEILEQDCL